MGEEHQRWHWLGWLRDEWWSHFLRWKTQKMGWAQGSEFRFADLVCEVKTNSRWCCTETWSSGEIIRLPLPLSWETPDCTCILKSKGLLSTNESNLILFLHAVLLRCLIHLLFSFIILFLLLHLIIHYPSWDTGREANAIMYIKVLWKAQNAL